MVETRDLAQLRQLNLELLRQLWVGQDAVRRSVAKAASESSLDSSSSYDSEMPSSQETSSVASRASCPQDAHQGDPCDRDGASSGVISLPPAKCLHQESPGPLRPHSAPLLATSGLSDPELSAELDSLDTQEAQALKSILAQRSKLSEPRVTNKESPVPEKSWRLRPCLGYDWIAGSLDNSSPVTSKPEAFFSKLQKFREANKEECICSGPESQFLGLQESGAVEGDHEWVVRVGSGGGGASSVTCVLLPCQPAPVSGAFGSWHPLPPVPDTTGPAGSGDPGRASAGQHCLLGWDILPPKSEKSSAPKSLDLWSSVSSEAQRRKLSATSLSHRVRSRVPWERQMPWSSLGTAESWGAGLG
eukprot:bmy_12768T0